MTFETYKTESLERIAADPRHAKHHAEIEAILLKRPGHLLPKRGIEVLTAVARSGKTTTYKVFYESCVGGNAPWNHTKLGAVAKFLGILQRHCAEQGLPILTALVVNQQTGQCGTGFFKDLVSLRRATPLDTPLQAEQQERDLCWAWAAAL